MATPPPLRVEQSSTCQHYCSPLAWDKQCKRFIPQDSNQCVHLEVPTGVLTQLFRQPPLPLGRLASIPSTPSRGPRTTSSRGSRIKPRDPPTHCDTRFENEVSQPSADEALAQQGTWPGTSKILQKREERQSCFPVSPFTYHCGSFGLTALALKWDEVGLSRKWCRF